jgi:hypothetical protein
MLVMAKKGKSKKRVSKVGFSNMSAIFVKTMNKPRKSWQKIA